MVLVKIITGCSEEYMRGEHEGKQTKPWGKQKTYGEMEREKGKESVKNKNKKKTRVLI